MNRSAANRRVAEWYKSYWFRKLPNGHTEQRSDLPDLWADSPEGAAFRESVEFELSENHSVYISLHDALRQWNEVPRVCRANALHAAVVALEGKEV